MEIRSSSKHIWNVKDILGQGATGAVYKGRHKDTGNEFAIKTTNHIGMMRPVEVRKREFEVLCKLKHPNIVKIYASENEIRSQNEIIVMELCLGGSLYTMLEHPSNTFGFNEKDCIDIIRDVVAGMKHLHEQGIVHRDLKPGNIMRLFRDDGTCVYKLTDFGAARELEPTDQFISIYGTEEYLHPDLYERGVLKKHSHKAFGANVDLWSIGVTFYHIATGKLPFRPHGGRQNKDTMYMITTKKKSGVISGVQKDNGANIEWSDRLPESCQLSQGFQNLLTPILAGVLESNPAKMITFDEFFGRVQDLVSRTVIVIYHVQFSSFHRIYIQPTAKFAKFQELVTTETGLQVQQQMLYINGEQFSPTPTADATTFPPTTQEHPMILIGGEFNEPRELKTPMFATLAAEWTLETDSAVAKTMANCSYSCKFSVKLYMDTITAMCSAIDVVIKSFKKEMLLMAVSCSRMDGRRKVVCDMTRVCCESQHHFIGLIADLLPQVQLSQGDNAAIEKDLHTIRAWIQSKHNSDQELGKVEHYLAKMKGNVKRVVEDDSLSHFYLKFHREATGKPWYALVSNSTTKVEDIYNRYRKDKHMRRLLFPDEQNHMFDRKRLPQLLKRTIEIKKEVYHHRVLLHNELKNWLTQIHLDQNEARKLQRNLDDGFQAEEVHMLSLETIQRECQLRYQRMFLQIKQAMVGAPSLSVATDTTPSLGPNGATSHHNVVTEHFLLEMDNKLKNLYDTTTASKQTAKENTEQLKQLTSSFTEFYDLLIDSEPQSLSEHQSLQQQQISVAGSK